MTDDILKVYSPYDHQILDEIPYAGENDFELAYQKAQEIYTDRSQWLPPYERIAILKRLIELMSSNVNELTAIAAAEGGKPFLDSEIEVHRAINGIQLAIEHISQIQGKQIPMGLNPASVNRIAYTFKEPIGVVSSISAFNHPLNLAVHQIIPAIAVAAPVVIKPAAVTPMSCLKLVEFLYQAGLPQDYCRVLICNRELAEKMVTDSRIAYLSFIGSAKVGWYLRSKLNPGAHCALEHGGAAPVIVEADADFDEMIPALVKGGFYHAGQVCVSVQRVFVHQTLVDKVAAAISEAAVKLKVGDPLDKQTEVGPLISSKEVERVENWVEQAVKAGAQCLCGGKRLSESCYEPTVLLNPPMDSLVSTEEIFGPVVCIYSYTNRDEAIVLANAVNFSFQAAVFTKNIDIALDTVNKLNATAVMVNDHTAFRVDWMPFGGRNHSGMGVGGIPYSMEEMMHDKMMVIKHN